MFSQNCEVYIYIQKSKQWIIFRKTWIIKTDVSVFNMTTYLEECIWAKGAGGNILYLKQNIELSLIKDIVIKVNKISE